MLYLNIRLLISICFDLFFESKLCNCIALKIYRNLKKKQWREYVIKGRPWQVGKYNLKLTFVSKVSLH